MDRIAVLGATSWGLTLAWLLAANGRRVTLLTRSAEEAHALAHSRTSPRLPELRLPDAIRFLPAAAAEPVDGVVVAVPAQSLRASVGAASLSRSVPVLSAAKGLETETGLRMTEVLAALGWPDALTAALSGPNLAAEIAKGLPAAAVVASRDAAVAAEWQRALATPAYRVYRSDDVVGVELGGALKNVIAIAAGAAAGLEAGSNAIAAIMTRGLAEMTRLGTALGADPLTFQGLAGVGDLAATCFSPLSRNRRLGELLARGHPLEQALDIIGEAVEGVPTAPVALAKAKTLGIDVPVTEQVAAVLAGRATVIEAMRTLLSRPLTEERPLPGLVD